PPWTAPPAGSRRCAPTWAASSRGTARSARGTARCTDRASTPTGACSRARRWRICRRWTSPNCPATPANRSTIGPRAPTDSRLEPGVVLQPLLVRGAVGLRQHLAGEDHQLQAFEGFAELLLDRLALGAELAGGVVREVVHVGVEP